MPIPGQKSGALRAASSRSIRITPFLQRLVHEQNIDILRAHVARSNPVWRSFFDHIDASPCSRARTLTSRRRGTRPSRKPARWRRIDEWWLACESPSLDTSRHRIGHRKVVVGFEFAQSIRDLGSIGFRLALAHLPLAGRFRDRHFNADNRGQYFVDVFIGRIHHPPRRRPIRFVPIRKPLNLAAPHLR